MWFIIHIRERFQKYLRVTFGSSAVFSLPLHLIITDPFLPQTFKEFYLLIAINFSILLKVLAYNPFAIMKKNYKKNAISTRLKIRPAACRPQDLPPVASQQILTQLTFLLPLLKELPLSLAWCLLMIVV